MQAIEPIAKKPLHAVVVDRLRDRIVRGDLVPGERLNERLLCEELGISRTPLREALKVLAMESLVVLLPHRGARVAPLEAEHLTGILEVMGALEGLAGELACRHATDEQIAEVGALHQDMLAMHARGDLVAYFRYNQAIHLKIVDVSGNATLGSTYRQLNANVLRARYMANLSRERWDEAVREHEAILAALKARDAPKLMLLLQDHLANKLAGVVQLLQKAA